VAPVPVNFHANSGSACPVKSGVPIDAAGIIPINQDDVAGIPAIAFRIPDFEGQAILRIFSNSTKAEIGCFAAQITNGNTFRQQAEVGTILGVFTLVAVVSSFATAIYGDNVVEMRKHYAHSLSVIIVFAVWHHIYFTGALSMNWPNILVSFWSNYAWTGGMIYSEHMQNTINDFIGSNKGNTSQVGAAGTGENNPDLGGGYDITAIYKRELANTGGGFSYTGQPVKPGLPLPGNFSGFAGTLAQERIPASNAFMTSLLWSLVLIACIIVSIVAFKVMLEALSKSTLIKKERLRFFRSHWVRYTLFAVLRAGFIGFFMIAFVTMFQFSYLKSSGLIAVACAVFLVAIGGIGTAAGWACYRRLKKGEYVCEPDAWNLEKTKIWKVVPWIELTRQSEHPRSEDKEYVGSIPWWLIRASSGEKSVHEDEGYILSFGWLASRYRRSRGWFFAVWLVYEFTRACFLAGASNHPLIQVIGLLAVDTIGLLGIICLRPFKGQRLNALLMMLLGISKVTTTGLSVAFDTRFNLPRILATVIGIVIIVIQGLLTVILLFAIVIGAVTSYFSITRNREVMRPQSWMPMREEHFRRIDRQGASLPKSRSIRFEPVPEVQRDPYFNVNQVKRVAKVEDEDDELMHEMHDLSPSRMMLASETQTDNGERPPQRARAASNLSQVSKSALPRAARLHRPNWNSQEFARPRTGSNVTVTTFNTPDRRTNKVVSPRIVYGESEETATRRTSPLSADASPSDTFSSSSPLPPHNDDEIRLLRRPDRQARMTSHSSLRPQGNSGGVPGRTVVRKSSVRLLTDEEAK
jgi:hypothetical protein